MMKIDENEKMKLNSWISRPKLGVSEKTTSTDVRIPFILGGYLGAKYGNRRKHDDATKMAAAIARFLCRQNTQTEANFRRNYQCYTLLT